MHDVNQSPGDISSVLALNNTTYLKYKARNMSYCMNNSIMLSNT